MPLEYDIPDRKKVRVIIDSDAACEADDPFAIVHALLSKKFIVKAIFAEHFVEPGSMLQSYNEIMTILNIMKMDVPVFKGENGPLHSINKENLSEAGQFLINEAENEDDHPLFVLCIGAITNIANAILHKPEIAKKMTIVWIGGHKLDIENPDHKEFNSGNDIKAANIVMSSGAEFWQIPNNVYGTMHIGLSEIQNRISPCGEIGKHLFENMVTYNNSPKAGWTAGESWSLGDSPAVGVVLEPNCGHFVYRKAPFIREDTSYRKKEDNPLIRVYQSINSRFILEDFISKLQLTYC